MARFTRVEICSCAVSLVTLLASCDSPGGLATSEAGLVPVATASSRANDCKAPNAQSTQRGCKALIAMTRKE